MALESLPRVMGVSLGGLRDRAFLFHGADGRQVARADPEGDGWWWLRVGHAGCPALVSPPRGRLLDVELAEVAAIRMSALSGEMVVGDQTMGFAPRGRGPGGRVRRHGTDAISVTVQDDRRVAVVEHAGALAPPVTVFAVVSLLRWSVDERSGLVEVLRLAKALPWV